MTIEIQSREQVEDKIRANVVVKDGETEKFGRSFTRVTWSEIETDIDQLRKNLEAAAVELEKVPIGVFVPPIREVPQLTPLELASQTLHTLKEKISIGVLKETDREWLDAISAYKAAESVR